MQRRLLVRTASFCSERSGHFDSFDQGLSFFLPNMTWLQPPGHVHAMVAASRLPLGLPVTVLAAASLDMESLSVSAQRSAAGDALVVRLVNSDSAARSPQTDVNVTFDRMCAACNGSYLTASPAEANPSWDPFRVSPRPLACKVVGGRSVQLSLSPSSFSVLQLSGCR